MINVRIQTFYFLTYSEWNIPPTYYIIHGPIKQWRWILWWWRTFLPYWMIYIAFGNNKSWLESDDDNTIGNDPWNKIFDVTAFFSFVQPTFTNTIACPINIKNDLACNI